MPAWGPLARGGAQSSCGEGGNRRPWRAGLGEIQALASRSHGPGVVSAPSSLVPSPRPQHARLICACALAPRVCVACAADRPTNETQGARSSPASLQFLNSGGGGEAQPETRAVMAWLRQALPRLSANFHGGALGERADGRVRVWGCARVRGDGAATAGSRRFQARPRPRRRCCVATAPACSGAAGSVSRDEAPATASRRHLVSSAIPLPLRSQWRATCWTPATNWCVG